jgi:transposase-like protein
MDRQKDTAFEAILEQLIEHGPGDIASVFAQAFELAMQIERERFLGAGLYERTAERQGYANGYKPKRIDTPAGTVHVQVPKTAGHAGVPFYPQSLERGRRSVRAVMLAVAEMYIKGVSTREVEAVMRELVIESLGARGLREVEFIVSDDHSGLRAARRAVLGAATWQRCQFHLARNAIHHAPNIEIRKRIGRQLKSIWTADDLAKAETSLAELVASYRDTASKLADWLEKNVPEALAVFTLAEHHRKRLRTSNPIERSVQQELKRRTVKVRVFPGEYALLRLVSAVLVEIDEKWASDTKAYIKWECQDARRALSRISRHEVAQSNRTLLDNLHKRPARGIIEDRGLAGSLAVKQPIRAQGVEADDPVAHDLKGHTPGPGGLAPAAAVINLSQRRHPSRLVRALRQLRQSPQRRPVKIISQAYR